MKKDLMVFNTSNGILVKIVFRSGGQDIAYTAYFIDITDHDNCVLIVISMKYARCHDSMILFAKMPWAVY